MQKIVLFLTGQLLCHCIHQQVVDVDGYMVPPHPSRQLLQRRNFDVRVSLHLADRITTDSVTDAGITRCSRRDFAIQTIAKAAGVASLQVFTEPSIAADTSSLDKILLEIRIARNQMNTIPDLIKAEQWDSIRAILITPPLSDLWTKSARKLPLLQEYANVMGDIPLGDELAVLEAKEDVEGHLRFLDMAAYNNVFNPIKSVGETSATKALIRSYYDDPINEYKASIVALEELIQLGNIK
jgi:hypothetical protein